MSEILAFLFTPTGVLLYAAFWLFKILLGAWLVRHAIALLPLRAQEGIEAGLRRLRFWRVRGPMG